MTIQKQRVTCQSCSTVSDVEIVVNAPISVALASMKAVRCSHCGGSKLGLGGSYNDAPPLSAPVQDRAQWWHERGEVGISSETIWSAFTHSSARYLDVPQDPDDYRRCRLLLDLIPEWRSKLAIVARVYPWFRPFTEAWDELDALWAEESPRKQCPKMFNRMRELVRESSQIRKGA